MSEAYKEAGVDIGRGLRFVSEIAGMARKTASPQVLGGLGGFAGLFALPPMKDPVLVGTTDGVGTKILLAREHDRWEGIGQDLVAMCLNDLLCVGAKPLFFLDYVATSRIEINRLKVIIHGIVEACQKTGCALLGGETAEMPGLYQEGDCDLAGFAVGAVEKEKIIDGRSIRPGDSVLGVASSGFHSNGFSLVRKILRDSPINLQTRCAETGKSLLENLLEPTRLYGPPLEKALGEGIAVKGIAHITGGGLLENPPRILPKGCAMEIRAGSWPVPEWMALFQSKGNLDRDEFYRVFNAGIGLAVVVAPKEAGRLAASLQRSGESVRTIGTVVPGERPGVHFV